MGLTYMHDNLNKIATVIVFLILYSIYPTPAFAIWASISTNTINIDAGQTASWTVKGSDFDSGSNLEQRWSIPTGLTVTKGASTNLLTFEVNTASSEISLVSSHQGKFSATINVTATNGGTFVIQNTRNDFGIGSPDVTVNVTGPAEPEPEPGAGYFPSGSLAKLCAIVDCNTADLANSFGTIKPEVLTNVNSKVSPETGIAISDVGPSPVTIVMEVVQLPFRDPAVSVTNCSSNSNQNFCNETSIGHSEVSDNPTIYGSHRQSTMVGLVIPEIGNDKGYDRFTVSLKNGWVIDHVKFRSIFTSENESIDHTPNSDGVGRSVWPLTVNWSVSPSDRVSYKAWIWIKGPKGVPYY